MEAILLNDIKIDSRPCDILIRGERIEAVAPAGTVEAPSGAERLDCRGKAAVPGLVNMHTHAAMSLMRGIGEDIPFDAWIDRIWKIEENLDEDYIYWATKAACLEMMRTGTTSYNDQYWFSPVSRRAAEEMGLRATLSYVVLDHLDRAEAERQKVQCRKMYEDSLSWGGTCSFSMAFHAIYSVSEEMMLWSSAFAREKGLRLHIHLSETRREVEDCRRMHGGMTPVEYLDSLGILGPEVIAAHTLWLTERDVEILGRRGVTCVHNVNSNMKLSSGYRFLWKELAEAGANVCIGTDGCASSNNLDMLEAMKTSAIVQKAWRDDPAALPIDSLMAMATLNGAKALGTDVGRIEPGALADLLIVDTENTFFLSPAPFLANFIHSAHSDCVESVICNGRFVMRNRKIDGEEEILSNARRVMEGLFRRAGMYGK